MTRTGMVELFRRFLCLLLLTLGLIALGYWGGITAGMLFGGALCVYVVIPRPRPPPSAMIYEKMPAVYGPDMLGLMMTSIFLALPFWVGKGEEYLWQDAAIPIHPSALLSWPLAIVSALILIVAASYSSFWITIEMHGLHIHSLRQDRFVAYSQITRVAPFRRGLPGWLKWLTPLFILTGRHTVAGAVLLARDTTGFSLFVADGSVISIDESAFASSAGKIMKTLKKKGVTLEIDS